MWLPGISSQKVISHTDLGLGRGSPSCLEINIKDTSLSHWHSHFMLLLGTWTLGLGSLPQVSQPDCHLCQVQPPIREHELLCWMSGTLGSCPCCSQAWRWEAGTHLEEKMRLNHCSGGGWRGREGCRNWQEGVWCPVSWVPKDVGGQVGA